MKHEELIDRLVDWLDGVYEDEDEFLDLFMMERHRLKDEEDLTDEEMDAASWGALDALVCTAKMEDTARFAGHVREMWER